MSAHLAQVNIGRIRGPIDGPVMKEFVDALDEINALAEQSPGFVWRFQTPEGNATSVQPYEDPTILINLSVWDSVETLKAYVYGSQHAQYMARRAAWFEKLASVHFALWWIPAGTLPSLDDAKQRLDHRQTRGDTPYAFSFKHPFPADIGLAASPQSV